MVYKGGPCACRAWSVQHLATVLAYLAVVSSAPLRLSRGGGAAGTSSEVVAAALLSGEQPAAGEAVTVKTWIYLKENMEKIRDEVRSIMSVRDDIAMLQEDLKTQEKVWHQAEDDLKKENAALLSQVELLRAQARQGEAVRLEVQHLKADIEAENRTRQESWLAVEHEEKRHDLERSYYAERRANVTKLLWDLNSTAALEVGQAHERQLQLETDSVALHVKAAELQGRVRNGAKELMQQEQQASAKTLELKHQLSGMQDGQLRVQVDLQKSGDIVAEKEELAKMKLELQKEINFMVAVKEEQAQVVARCATMKNQRNDVLCAEQKKADQRQQESKELCQPVNGQLAALQAMLSDCQRAAALPATR